MAALEERSFAARFKEAHVLFFDAKLPPLELEQGPATLDEGAADPLGTGSTVWRGGDVLARALAQDPSLRALVEGKRVLELGSGTGVAGLACAALGARAVRLTDLPERLDLLRRNATRNRGHAFGVDVDVAPYAWGDKFGAMALAADGVDVVVGADVCYAQGMVPPLVASVLALMDHAEVCILACERHEPVAYAALKNALAERLDASAVAAVASADVEIVVFRRRRAAAAAANVS